MKAALQQTLERLIALHQEAVEEFSAGRVEASIVTDIHRARVLIYNIIVTGEGEI